MLHRGAPGLARQLRQACLMDEVATPRLDADRAHMLQPLDHPEHGGGLGRLRHLSQPGKPAQAAFLPMFGQGVEALALFGGKPPGQPAMRLPARAMAQISAQTLQRCRRRDDNAARAARLHHQIGQEGEPIVLDRQHEQRLCHLSGSKLAKRAQPKLLLALDRVALPVPVRREIFVDAVRKGLDLICNERPQRRRGALAGAQRAAGEAQVAEHQRVAEPIVIAAAAPDRDEVSVGQRVVADQLTLLRRRLEQLRELRFAQSLPSRHPCLLTLLGQQTSRCEQASR